MNKLNVLHLRASNFYGGPERQLHFHAKCTVDSKYAMIVSSFLENGQTPEFLEVISRDNIRVHTFNVSGPYDPKAFTLVRKYLINNNISILCTHDYRSHLIGMLASRRVGTKWIAFSRGWTAENLKIRLFHVLDKIIVRFADHIVAVSHSQKEKLKRLFIADKNISVVHNSVQPSAFDQIKRVDLRHRFKLPPDSIVGISGGRFSLEKGQRFLVDAVAIALRDNTRLRFIMFGDGPDYEAIQAQIETLDLRDCVICPGFEKNLIGCLKGADLLVNPSLSEGLPNIVLEAMAVRIPCIATAVGGVGEIIEHNSNGLLTPSKSSEKLAEAILKIAGDGNLSSKLADNAYETILDRFSFDSQFTALSLLYNSLLS